MKRPLTPEQQRKQRQERNRAVKRSYRIDKPPPLRMSQGRITTTPPLHQVKHVYRVVRTRATVWLYKCPWGGEWQSWVASQWLDINTEHMLGTCSKALETFETHDWGKAVAKYQWWRNGWTS